MDMLRIGRLFRILGPRLAAVRRIDLELDRALANRFNPLDYLRTDELGLSRIIADLLDPRAAHGQGTTFLLRFLERIRDTLPGGWPSTIEPASIDVRCERSIDGGGRLDVSVEISFGSSQPLCLAIENKPYAADGEGQIDAYLQFLRSRYPGRFLLIYLSPHGGLPSADSLTPGACTDGLATLSYSPLAQTAADQDTSLQLAFALTDWLRECSLSCAVDRLRWFLRDTENFCHKTFGGVLTSDREHLEVRKFILDSEDNLLAALAVRDAYPKTRDEVIRAFLERLRDQIADELRQEGLEAGFHFADNPKQDGVWAHRSSWWGESSIPYIWLGHDGKNASGWWKGVGFYPYGSKDLRIDNLRKPLTKEMGPPTSSRSDNFPWYRFLDQHQDWAPLLVRMHQERQHPNPGELIKHFTAEFATFARKAAKIIDSEVAAK